MKIVCVTNHFSDSVASLFGKYGDVEVMKSTKKLFASEDVIDLLVFTGGDDVNPERYGQVNESSYFDTERDNIEFNVISGVLRNKVSVNKILGLCRGLQVLNVAMGGTLWQDIRNRFGESHPPRHELKWLVENPLNFLTSTNSLHHQGIKVLGNTTPKFRPQLLAVEPKTNIPEVVTWGDKILGFQSHPEFFPDSSIKTRVVDTIVKWVNGKIKLDKEDQEFREIKMGSWSTTFLHTNTSENQGDNNGNI